MGAHCARRIASFVVGDPWGQCVVFLLRHTAAGIPLVCCSTSNIFSKDQCPQFLNQPWRAWKLSTAAVALLCTMGASSVFANFVDRCAKAVDDLSFSNGCCNHRRFRSRLWGKRIPRFDQNSGVGARPIFGRASPLRYRFVVVASEHDGIGGQKIIAAFIPRSTHSYWIWDVEPDRAYQAMYMGPALSGLPVVGGLSCDIPRLRSRIHAVGLPSNGVRKCACAARILL